MLSKKKIKYLIKEFDLEDMFELLEFLTEYAYRHKKQIKESDFYQFDYEELKEVQS